MSGVDPHSAPGFLKPLVEKVDEVTAHDIHRFSPPDSGVRESAVLMLFSEGRDGPDVLLTERAASMRSHSGQVAFPGGSRDPEDDGPISTALREANEEVGLDPSGVRIHAMMPDLYIPVSRFSVTPVIASAPANYRIGALDPGEVAQALRVSIDVLADPDIRYTVTMNNGYRGPAFVIDELFVWGFTANVLDAVLRLGGFAREWDEQRTMELPRKFWR